MRLEKLDFPTRVAVNGLSFTTYPGEIFGLLGPNGAGKTTTMRIIATLIKPDAGEVFIDGTGLDDDNTIKKDIAFLTSDLKIDPKLTPDYLFDFFSALFEVEDKVREERKYDLFTRFGIDRFAHVKVADLSQGMRQKLSIVLALVHDPKVIVFDEPTNGLDITVARTVTDYLKELAEQGKNVIISTHIMSLVQKLCTRVGIIIEGKMVECGMVSDLLSANPGKDLEDIFFDVFSKYSTAEGGK
ncbi:MAG: ABC transporter ATP-binding protein [Clostridia bacterium]|nr:ABC transporter ATP-binding protein [Clostridia bacterium]